MNPTTPVTVATTMTKSFTLATEMHPRIMAPLKPINVSN